jgi:hypothetical protein
VANFTDIEQRIDVLSHHIRYMAQTRANKQEVQALSRQIQVLDSQLKELKEDLRARRLEPAPVRR